MDFQFQETVQIIDSGPSMFASNFYLTTCDFAQRAVLYLMDVFVLVAAVVFTFLHLCNVCTYACHDMYVRSEGNLLESVLPLLLPGFQS